MNAIIFIYIIILFIVLTPGQFITLPKGNHSKLMVNLTHAIIFAIIYYFTHKIIWDATKKDKENIYSTV
jgi:amino acid permease